MTETGQRMKKTYIIRTALVIIAITGLFLVVRSRATHPKADSCKESLDACSRKDGSGKMIWENLSQQFFSSL
jgi:hypothetical protein